MKTAVATAAGTAADPVKKKWEVKPPISSVHAQPEPAPHRKSNDEILARVAPGSPSLPKRSSDPAVQPNSPARKSTDSVGGDRLRVPSVAGKIQEQNKRVSKGTDHESKLDKFIASHGAQSSRTVMSCLAIARAGLSALELADILSIEEDCLNEAFLSAGFCPQLRRFPQNKLNSILRDLESLMLLSGKEGFKMFLWKDAVLKTLVIERYFGKDSNDVKNDQKYHTLLSDFFSWEVGRRKYK